MKEWQSASYFILHGKNDASRQFLYTGLFTLVRSVNPSNRSPLARAANDNVFFRVKPSTTYFLFSRFRRSVYMHHNARETRHTTRDTGSGTPAPRRLDNVEGQPGRKGQVLVDDPHTRLLRGTDQIKLPRKSCVEFRPVVSFPTGLKRCSTRTPHLRPGALCGKRYLVGANTICFGLHISNGERDDR